MLVFTPPEHSAQVIDTFSAYALSESPEEPGAAEHRFVVERIDPAKGSAVGYVAKYVSKSIDGEGVGIDNETGEAGASSASRIVAWARLWGNRRPIVARKYTEKMLGCGAPEEAAYRPNFAALRGA